MSLQHSPQIVTNGLVFYYDMSNTKKSWKGANTINLITNGDFSNGLTGYNTYVTSPTIVTTTSVPSTLGISRNIIQSTPTATIGGGGNYGGFNWTAPVLTVGQPYTLSFYARCLNGTMGLTFSNQNGSGDNSNLASTWALNGQWQYLTKTTASLDLVKNTMFFWNNKANSSFQIADLQLENSSFANPFTSNTRTNTQSVIDLTNNNTVTATSLTYNSDGSFSFTNANSNYIDTNSYFNSTIIGTSSFTIEVWVNPNSTQVAYADICGNHGGAYSGFVIQQNSSSNNQYYFAFGNGSSYTISSNFNLTASVFNHLVVAKNGAYTSVYVNGTRVVYDNITAPIFPNTNYTVKIGQGWQDGLGRYFSGSIPSVKIYNRELSADEILQNFNAHKRRYGL